MDIFWGVVALLLVVGSTVAALALRREDPARPWFPSGSDGAWPGGEAWDGYRENLRDELGGGRRDRLDVGTVHGERWERDAQRLDADLRAAASRPGARVTSVDPHEVAAEIVLRRVVPNPAVRDGVRGVVPAPADAAVRTSGRASGVPSNPSRRPRVAR